MSNYKIVFSPTGGTSKVADAIANTWTDVETIDLAQQDFDGAELEAGNVAVVAMPSFGGLAPQFALDRLTQIKGNGAKCVIACIYGNRAYEDTLLQMKDYAEAAGFQVIAAISAVAEHSIIREYASGRPDAKDCAELAEYGAKVMAKAVEATASITVPGNSTYKKAGAAMVPKANSTCTACGTCAKECPASAITSNNPRKTDKSKCIGCMRCVAVCPAKARGINPLMAKIAAMALKKACAKPKANELMM